MAAWGYESYDYHDFEQPPPPHRRAPPQYNRPPLPRERPPPPPPPPREDGAFYHDHYGGGYGRSSPPPPPPPPPRSVPRGHPPSPRGYDHSPRGRGAINRGNSQQRGNGNFRGRGLPRGGYPPRGTSLQRGGSSPRGPFRGGPAARGGSSPRGQTAMRGSPQRGHGSNRGASRGRGSFTPNGHGGGNYTKANVLNTNTSVTSVKADSSGPVVQSVATSPANNIAHSDQSASGQAEPAAPYSYQSLAQAKRKLSTGAQEDVKAVAPGQANFISFKNSLQEYCQKKRMPVPAYNSFRNSFGYSAKVEVAGQTIQSSSIQKERKDAEQNAAYEALKILGLIVATVQFTAKPPPAKRPSLDDGEFDAKKMRFDLTANMSFKSKLNEFCQKFRLPIPTYETVRNGKGFISTLIYNKKVYQSNAPQKTKKLAEQNAAQVVLHKLGQAPAPEPTLTDAIQKCAELCSQVNVDGSGTSATTNSEVSELASTSDVSTIPNVKLENSTLAVTPSFPIVTPLQDSPEVSQASQLTPKVTLPQPHMSYKNHLQEYCQKNKIELPQYETLRENGVFVCTVNVAGNCYKSSGCKTKKGSEQNVARVALQSMGLLQPNQA